ncbi:MAG TPA: carbon monoxide dehydrogenase subunit G [Terriglobia bacterium]|nr:carbon monoxide dehydrogenase subunit G [Terriglobia bacterium]
MKLEVDHVFPAGPQELWDVLLDPVRLQRCVPGCEQMQEDGQDHYVATLKIGVASVKGTYTGQVRLSEKNAYSSYRMSVEGSGKPGFVRGEAAIGLIPQEGRQTRLAIRGEAHVGGLIASVGQRLLHGIARQLIGTFFRNIEKELANGDPSSAVTPKHDTAP